jgi:catechol 2,3-dioxygenase-like lactoylglutathione lyase family enzyme
LIRIHGLDHFVLRVTSIEDAAVFYERVLGMEVERYGEGRMALRFGNQKINLHDDGHAPPQTARDPRPGGADFCLVVEGPVDAILTHLGAVGVAVEKGPVTRNGARGPMESIYFRDPDENLVELSVYGES